jgi:flagellar motility protein MotE (MotC chaperone)
MSKKRIIITAAAGLVSFLAAFAASWLIRPARPADNARQGQATAEDQQAAAEATQQQEGVTSATEITADGVTMKTFSEKELKGLVHDVRLRIQQYDSRLKDIELREQRLRVVQDTVDKDIEGLNNLRVELATMVANLKGQRDALLKSRAEIAQAEKANLVSIAATYDKMDPTSASKILSNMCTNQIQTGRQEGSSIDDAVKILYHMTERTKAKLLAEMVASEPKLAALLCQRLKQVVEQK